MATQYTEQQLIDLINHHNDLYWNQAEPEITDEEFDELLRQLEALNPDHPLITKVNAPTVAGSGKVRHSQPMLSLDKAYSLEEVIKWAEKYIRSQDELLQIQPKYDGISANYAAGILATRGDGEEGENITDKLPLIELEAADYKGPVRRPVRGEIVIRDDDFKTLYANIKKKDGKSYKNSRNAVAGIMGLKEIDNMVAQGAKLTLVDYEKTSYQVPFRDLAKRWPGIVDEIEHLPYPMDGIVIKIADTDYSISLGNTAHHPRGQIAFKFSGIRKTSKLLAVEWSFGKNCLTPVAELEPVEIGGITIRHATLHNYQNIIDKDIEIGDKVVVERAGDVIPYIVSALPGHERQSAIITNCPCCQTELKQSGPELYCPNPDCFETNLQRLVAAVKNIGIERLGEPNIRKMMVTLNVTHLKDIFELELIDILKLDGFKQKSATNLYREIQTAKQVQDFQVLAALNISGIGKNVAKDLLKRYTLSELRKLSLEELAAIHGIGPERAQALFGQLQQQADFLDELLTCVSIQSTKEQAQKMADKPTICFTGKMPEKRSFYEALATENGYSPTSSVNKDLSILVAQDINGGSSKIKKAAKAGTTVMALADWLAGLEDKKTGNAVDCDEAEITAESSDSTGAPEQLELF